MHELGSSLVNIRPLGDTLDIRGETREILSVSWRDAPPGHRMCRLVFPKSSPFSSPVAARAQ